MKPPKYPRTFHWYTSPGIQSDDKMHNNCENFIGKEVVITEKYDGGNTLLYNGKVYARSTGNETTQKWFAMVKKYHGWKTFQNPLYFYGEDLYGVHSIEYNALYENQTFHLFNVRNDDNFLHWNEVINWSIKLNFPIVHEIFRGFFSSIQEIDLFFKTHINSPSHLGNVKEGFVMRIVDSFNAESFSENVVKYVREGHQSTNRNWITNWKPCNLKYDN